METFLDANVQTLSDFREYMTQNEEDDDWLDDPVIGLIEPFGILAGQTINSRELGVDYDLPPIPERSLDSWTPDRSAKSTSRLAPSNNVYIRVEGFQRLGIPGSVLIELLANETVIANQYIFQSTIPKDCPTCIKQSSLNVDFDIIRSIIENKKISIRVYCVSSKGRKEHIGLEQCGNPVLSVRLPLDTN